VAGTAFQYVVVLILQVNPYPENHYVKSHS
jgi:hypothetical protein